MTNKKTGDACGEELIPANLTNYRSEESTEIQGFSLL